MGDSSNVPTEYLPRLRDLQSFQVKTRFPKGLKVFVFASEPGSHSSPEEGYDDYQNSVIAEVEANGLLKFVLETPGEYYVREDRTRYPAHLHLVPEDQDKRGQWSDKLYTYVV
jgi:hypothetical protein